MVPSCRPGRYPVAGTYPPGPAGGRTARHHRDMTTPDIAAELAALRHRIDALESQERIRALRNRFHDFVNTDRWEEIGTLFAEDAELDYDYLGSASGRAAVGEFFGAIPRLLPDGDGTFVRQLIHAHDVEVDGLSLIHI